MVAYRVPAGLSVVAPPSACPDCGSEIRPFDNIPVLSWLVLRGRCRDCHGPISARYPIVEAITGVFFVLVALRFLPLLGTQPGVAALIGELVEFVAFLYLAAISVALAAIDLDTRTLPNRIVLPAYLVGGGFIIASAVLTGDLGGPIGAGIGLAALFILYFTLAMVRPGGMGFGDVKLAGVIGMYLGYLGWGPLAIGAFSAFVLGGVFGIALLALRRARRGSGIPFGPWMLAGAWIGIFFGQALWNDYLALIGLA
ncbi:A24 family peptidase [Leifsonia poae]|uniref:Prepilin leader peptidase/N-methyltransferase n=1 Tax=Leifsonia poae TaxID=110933 RepID=A0A9W6H7X3_9MICO|nr:prepilin peptidase [Leifsonia poae]